MAKRTGQAESPTQEIVPPAEPEAVLEGQTADNEGDDFLSLIEGTGVSLDDTPEPTTEQEPSPAPEQPEAAPAEDPEAGQETEIEPEEAPERPDPIQRRFDQLTARAKSAEERAAAAEAKLAEQEAEFAAFKEQQPTEPTESNGNGYSPDPEINKLREQENKWEHWRTEYRKLLRTLGRRPEEVEARLRDLKAPVSEWSEDGIRDWLENAVDYASDTLQRVRSKALVAQARHEENRITQRQQFEQVARAKFNWMTDPSTPEAKLASQLIAQRPYLKHDPLAPIIIGATVQWAIAERQRGNKPASPAPAAPRKGTIRPPGAPAAAATREPVNRAAAAWEKVQNVGDDQSLQAALAEQFS